MEADGSWLWQARPLAYGESQTFPRQGTRNSAWAMNEPFDGEHDPRFRKIAEGVEFTQRLILTYHLVVVLVLALVSVSHWSKTVVRAWRRRRAANLPCNTAEIFRSTGSRDIPNEQFEDVSSSGSSTIEGTVTPPRPPGKVEDESTPLLHARRPTKAGHRAFRRIKSTLMYQPRPLPVVNKIMPDNGTTVFVLAFVALNIFYTLYCCPWELPALFIFADRCSALFVANLPLLYLFAAKNQPIKILTGRSYESLNILHRRLGEILCLLALLHTACMFGVWYTILGPVGWTLLYFVTRPIVILGLFAFTCYETLYFTSLGSFRQRWYELFLSLHIFLQAAALILVFFHHPRSRVYVGIALAIFLIDRLALRMLAKTRTVHGTLTLLPDNETVRFSTTFSLDKSNTANRSVLRGWSPTDHVFLTVPALSRLHTLQAHPFTIASPAPTPSSTHTRLDLLIRSQSGFSASLAAHAHTHHNITARLDGPYGSPTALATLSHAKVPLIVAGGSGIAVAIPLLYALTHHRDTEASTPSRPAPTLLWIVRDETHRAWLTDEDREAFVRAGVKLVLPAASGAARRPDVAALVRGCVEAGVEEAGGAASARAGVVCSGPDGMNRAVRNACADMAARGIDVDVEIEKFGW